MCITAQSAHADNIYKFMQFNCDESKNTLEIKKVHATDYPEFKSLDEASGVIKDLGVEYTLTDGISAVKEGQLPKSIANCSLQHPEKGIVEFTLSLTEIHLGKVRGLCAAASGPAYEVLLNNKVVARFQSEKDRCYYNFNPLDIARMEYSWGLVGLCRIPHNSSSNIQSLQVRFEGELCLYGTPEGIVENQQVMKNFEQELFDDIALDEAKRELHTYKNQKFEANLRELKQNHQRSIDKFETIKKEHQDEIYSLRKELDETKSKLKAEESKPFWKRIFNKAD